MKVYFIRTLCLVGLPRRHRATTSSELTHERPAVGQADGFSLELRSFDDFSVTGREWISVRKNLEGGFAWRGD